MVSTFTNGKMHLEKPAAGDYVDAWAPPINANFDAADAAVSNTTLVTITSADITLTLPQARAAYINCSGALSATRQLIFPNTAGGLAGGAWVINNGCSGAFTLTAIVSGGTGVLIPQGHRVLVISDGTNLVQGDDWIAGAIQQVTASPNGSLTGEAGTIQDPVTSLRFDNVARRLYAALGGTSWIAIAAALPLLAADITDLNVTNPKLAGPRMTAQWLTSGTAATYNTPANCKTLIAIVMGDGGGGGAANNNNGSAGSSSIFDGIQANGGSGGPAGTVGLQGYGGLGGTAGGGAALLRIPGSAGVFGFQSNNNFQSGGTGAPGLFGMGAGRGGQNNTAGGAGGAGTGAGGGAGSGSQNSSQAGGGGGSGELIFVLRQNPAATYTYTVGPGGNGGAAGTQAGGNGGSGSILVLEFY